MGFLLVWHSRSDGKCQDLVDWQWSGATSLLPTIMTAIRLQIAIQSGFGRADGHFVHSLIEPRIIDSNCVAQPIS